MESNFDRKSQSYNIYIENKREKGKRSWSSVVTREISSTNTLFTVYSSFQIRTSRTPTV